MKRNQRKLGVVLSYISMGVGAIVSFLFTPIMLRLLGQSEYGLYNLVSSIVSYLSLFNLGFGSAYIKYYSKYKVDNKEDNVAKLNGMFLTVYSILGIIALVAGIFLASNTGIVLGKEFTSSEVSTATILMFIMVVNLALSFPFTVFNSYITANEQFIFQKVLQIIKLLIGPFVMLPVLLMGYGSIGIVIVTTLLTIVIEIINLNFCFKKINMKFLFKNFDFDLMKEMAIYSSYIFINMIVDQVNWNIDKYIIGRYKGSIPVAVYGIAAQINSYYMMFSTSISNVFTPLVHKEVAKENNSEEITGLFTKVGRIQFIVLSLICSAFIFFGRVFVCKWAGVDYAEAYIIAIILIVPVTVPLIQNLGIEIQRAKNLHKFRSWLYLTVAILNLFISIPLTKSYGAVGAAIGTSIAILIGNVLIMNLYYYYRVDINMKYFWKNIFSFIPSLIVPVLFGTTIIKRINLYSIKNFVLFGILYVLIFTASMWFLGMNQYEKGLIINLLNKYKGKHNKQKAYKKREKYDR